MLNLWQKKLKCLYKLFHKSFCSNCCPPNYVTISSLNFSRRNPSSAYLNKLNQWIIAPSMHNLAALIFSSSLIFWASKFGSFTLVIYPIGSSSIKSWQFHFLTAMRSSVLIHIKIFWIWSFAIISVWWIVSHEFLISNIDFSKFFSNYLIYSSICSPSYQHWIVEGERQPSDCPNLLYYITSKSQTFG